MLIFLKGIFKNHCPPHTDIGDLVSKHLTDPVFFRNTFKPHCSLCIRPYTDFFFFFPEIVPLYKYLSLIRVLISQFPHIIAVLCLQNWTAKYLRTRPGWWIESVSTFNPTCLSVLTTCIKLTKPHFYGLFSVQQI